MRTDQPWRVGIALALTMAISYSVCALAYALWPDQGISFLNALFHGLDFGRLREPAQFTMATFFYPLSIFVVWGFAVGTLFAWLLGVFARANS